ncbi:hypothetical protein PLICRDRAFT_43541 [Plicaturopsis crispa FD-325 SS-3]|nr:hypothetical protein PLICRDRAFT_43541 [Plicaturopsis crispa FD-325 SS-3]
MSYTESPGDYAPVEPAYLPSRLTDDDSEVDELEEQEVDELDSSEPESDDGGQENGGPIHRMPGTTLLPAVRVENIMQADGVTGSLSMSKEAQFLLSVATEEFIKRMAQAGQQHSGMERRAQVNYRDMALATQQYQEFMFLQETVPEPIPISEALRRREEKEKATIEDNPAIATYPPPTHPASTSFAAPSAGPSFLASSSRSKGKSRASTNGREKSNGKEGTSSRSRSKRDGKGRYSQGQTNGNGHAPEGHTSARPARSRSSRRSRGDDWEPVIPPAPSHSFDSRPDYPGSMSVFNGHMNGPTVGPEVDGATGVMGLGREESWPGQFTGPASAFLQPYRNASQNPGRTIYSQTMR